MTGLRQVWLVALREVRERSRSRSFRAGLVVMLVVVIAMIVVPAKLDTGGGTKDIGLTGAAPTTLSSAILAHGDAIGTTVRVHRYGDVTAGEEAVRAGDVDVLLVDAQQLEWPGRVDEQLQAIVTGAIQLVAVQKRATAAGMDPEDLRALMAPVPVENVELGSAAGRSPDDELAAIVMTALLLMAIVIYGNLVLTGVVEEKSSRVVEVLLARIPARVLLAGKVAGIGLLGFAQFALTAVAALVATLVIDSVDIPAVGSGVLAWAVVWFVLGYALYAMAYGALGSLASRTEDAQSVAGPIGYVLIACYWAAFLAVSGDPDGLLSRLLSLFPATAPFAMPGRIALGSVAWWEPLLAVALTLAAIAGLVALAGRVYTNAILHSGTTLRLRDAWHRDQAQPPMTRARGRAVRTIEPEGSRDPREATATDQDPRTREAATIHRRPEGSEPGEPTGVGGH
ncbi:ABC-2 type transport system permease protein [Kribbella orskensis]|uniref:ABC-2 type transport system permease protein n=1 Tax=Kribbella orskensis TaxID=2512216 RepID=A0ABY2BT88_9ACTN|nr:MULTISPECIES: ABC transporter permease [Kribbella]TCN44851.1 ABC-2 type transport system permease protein [Kribbella sp. VKM Ac-2500]TCO31371.1 ABC-2 type transport system permease protein [Kribbella orskensis]